ncbi:MAG: hypothetical protein WAM58_18045 [Candidatus Acidiferrum sp.]
MRDEIAARTDCKAGGCTNSAVSALAGREFCLNHFVQNCYEQLDMLEPKLRRRPLEVGEVRAAKDFLEECSNRTLVVCLRTEQLTNVERSRLLDILLSCGDLQLMLRGAHFGNSGLAAHSSPGNAS